MKSALSILALICVANATQVYPRITRSFNAKGSVTVNENGKDLEVTFEENFDAGVNRSAFTISESTIVEHLAQRKAFVYKHTGDCAEFAPRFADIDVEIQAFKVKQDRDYVIPLRQLLDLPQVFCTGQAPVTLPDGKKVNRWSFRINSTDATVDIEADWTVDTNEPVQFKVSRSFTAKTSAVSTQTVKVTSLTKGLFDKYVFRPRRGVFCEGLQVPSRVQNVVFKELKTLRDKVVNSIKGFKNTTTVVQSWFDRESQRFEVDYAPTIRSKFAKGVRQIVSRVQGAVYEINEARQCAVRAVKNTKANIVSQTIFNPLDDEELDSLFGTGKANYTAIGEITERGVPCVLYHGLRSDWPAGEKGIDTLWEWCLSDQKLPGVKFFFNDLPLVSLNIYIKKSPYKKLEESAFYEGLQLGYNFYSLRNQTQEYFDDMAVDIKDCFAETNQKILNFKVKIADKITRSLLERNARRVELIAAWKEAICKAAAVLPESLRISSVETRVETDLEVNFHLVGRHPGLPETSTEITLDAAVANVQTTLDKGELSVSVTFGNDTKPQEVNLKGEPGTLKAKSVVDDSVNKATSGISGGTMAAIAVVMLALGCAVGAAVIFVRKRNASYQKL